MSEHFSRVEMACHCGCGYDDATPELYDLLETIRLLAGAKPMTLTSVCRCRKHNEEIGGVTDSAHLRGTAADIVVAGGKRRREILNAAVAAGSAGIGIHRVYIHVDCDTVAPRPAAWGYGRDEQDE